MSYKQRAPMSDLSSEEQEVAYHFGYQLYQAGDYVKASDLFTRLVLCSPFENRFWKGLASSRQMHKNYPAALHAWSIYCLLSGEEPTGHFHAAECLLSSGDVAGAREALQAAEKYANASCPLPFEALKMCLAERAHV